MKWPRRMLAWWLTRPLEAEGHHLRGRFYGTRLYSLVRILALVFLFTVGLPITLAGLAVHFWRIYRGDVKWPYK